MLFALAFLPMFGIGGLTGLPLGLAASDIALHDTYYVVGHFHYLVAPGTLFAIFAGIYYWFPKITGRQMSVWMGHLHFWGSLLAMNNIFLPMFAMGLMGVNRRLFDAGQQYLHALPTLTWNRHITVNAVLLGVCQLPFLFNLHWSMRRGTKVGNNPWDATTLEWSTTSPPPHANFASPPQVLRGAYEYSAPGESMDFTPQGEGAWGASGALGAQGASDERRGAANNTAGQHPGKPEAGGLEAGGHHFSGAAGAEGAHPATGVTNGQLGMWLFLASEAMLMASLFSAYVLLRTGAENVPALPSSWPRALIEGTLLVGTVASLWRASRGAGNTRTLLLLGAGLALACAALQLVTAARVSPAAHVLIASWFTLISAHALHVAAGACALVWLARSPATRLTTRLQAVRLYWYFVIVTWVILVAAFP
jgi:heme/copper-type cytochrome/quinol oxidase subunit 3